MFDRRGALNLEGFEGSGADWLERYKPFIEDGQTIVASPHKVYGPETNDLVLQLRKRGIDSVILAGISANLCVESHMRGLLEQGFEVTAVKDGTAAAKNPELGDGRLSKGGLTTPFSSSKELTGQEFNIERSRCWATRLGETGSPSAKSL